MRPLLVSLVCLASWFASGLAVAGRPVFQKLTFDELVFRSNIVAVVQLEAPFQATHSKSKLGCDELRQSFRVSEVLALKTIQNDRSSGEKRLSSLVRAGEVISVVTNRTALTGCEYEAILKNGTGASFSAATYSSRTTATLRSGQSVLVFLQADGDRLFLTAEGAYEELSKNLLVRSSTEGQTR